MRSSGRIVVIFLTLLSTWAWGADGSGTPPANGTSTASANATSAAPAKPAVTTPLDRIKAAFEKAEPAKLSDLPEGDSTWAWRCVAEGAATRRYGFFFSFFRVHDQVLSDFVYGFSLTHANPKHYQQMSVNDATKLRDTLVAKQLDYYTDLAEEGTGLKATAEFPRSKGYWKEEVTDPESGFTQSYEIKVKREPGKSPVFFLKLYCRDSYTCEGDFGYHQGGRVYRDDPGAWCYLDKKIL